MRVLRNDQAAAKPAAELDLPTGLMTVYILHEERHAAERTVAERLLVELFDPVGVRLDHRIDRGIDRRDRLSRGRGEFPGRNLSGRDQRSETGCVVTRVLGEFHGLAPRREPLF